MAENPKILIVEARFYDDIADDLVAGAMRVLEDAGAEVERCSVPGSFELPGAISIASASNETRFDGYIALGCVIRGETDHYDYVCDATVRGLQDLAVNSRLAIGFGVLTCETRAQAEARARPGDRDAGGKAAKACLRMIKLRDLFGATRAAQ